MKDEKDVNVNSQVIPIDSAIKLIEISEEEQWINHFLNTPISLWVLIKLLKKLDLIDAEITEDQIIEMLD